MGKVNRRLLPIKAHFLFFMAAMGPILPQLSVLGKEIGISPEIMGVITSILPIMYIIAKPLFGFVADYFMKLRKVIFLLLILTMTLSYGAFYFIPNQQNHIINVNSSTELTVWSLQICTKDVLTSSSLCSSTRGGLCSDQESTFEVNFIDLNNIKNHEAILESNAHLLNLHVCLPMENFSNSSVSMVPIHLNCTVYDFKTEDCLYRSSTFWLFVIFMCMGTIGFNVTNSISDAICFDMLGKDDEDKYGAQRVWGTIGFGLTALLSGIVVDLWTVDTIKSFTPALLIMLIFSSLDMISVSKLKLPQLSASESIFKDVLKLISLKPIAIFLIFATMAGIIDSFIIYFMFWHMEEVAAETGFMSQIKLIEGCVVAAECLAGEVPFFFYSGKIIKKLGYINCMSMCFFFYAVRLALIAWIPNPWYLVGVELFFQGVTYALCYTCIVAYASAVAPPGTSATVQGLMAGMDDGLGFSIGSLIGGLSFKHFGGRRSFAYFAVAAIITCGAHIILRPLSRKQQYLPNSEYMAPTEQNETNESKI
ncbi:major facilitator superfamily domain-containing protein 6-A-like [Teleopsis dalmanni]|uniref:major facilitator superfamily domain-containing protein 6-A-like n=1 Tax=Teleopsis dalmanni TaxID=139649 RepID=UPI0018CD6BC1|nr:major facilitator superfamily domain-containing protein 6-A-like [Teleopsis dalmanni]XP_037951799.1 major facilitator superfamily domain-containing protein 6-A-like [Teleopsis dalmanni]XP_037951800.1 major facilitator superfamily domain-containing protein 6-A-like [Teleopsis dalmanni]XP_037951801.1 major facilitator superfamily domain-containing protein 6-A-like [Teleopsis dalmanni]